MRLILLLLALFLAASPSFAQQYSTKGFALGVGLQYAGVSIDEDLPFDASDSGGGLGLLAEYGFNETISIFVNLDGSGIAENTGLGHFDLGARLHFQGQPQLKPFLQAALSGVAVTNNEGEDSALSGGAFTVGGGLRYFMSRKVALDFQGAYSLGEFNRLEVGSQSTDDLNVEMHTYRLRFGVLFVL